MATEADFSTIPVGETISFDSSAGSHLGVFRGLENGQAAVSITYNWIVVHYDLADVSNLRTAGQIAAERASAG